MKIPIDKTNIINGRSILIFLFLPLALFSLAQAEKVLSLDEIDRRSYRPGPSLLDSKAETVELIIGDHSQYPVVAPLSLDGPWEMAQGGLQVRRLIKDWVDSMPATVPGSVHATLLKQGVIPDPTIGLNDAYAREMSFKTWWYKKTFKKPFSSDAARLVFGGIAVKADIWLNDEYLGFHEGMFGGPEYDISGKLQADNVLIVKIHPAPYVYGQGQPNDNIPGMNVGWLYTTVINNVYGWHYCNIPTVGIWRSVTIEAIPDVEIQHPFVAVKDARRGVVDLVTTLKGKESTWTGKLTGTIEPENFDGATYHFSYKVDAKINNGSVHLTMHLPDPKLWWPNDLGDQNLYKMKLSFMDAADSAVDYEETIFGIRTVEMAPVDGEKNPDLYNWTFVINGKPIFVKGNGWCTMDPLMDFSYERYEKFIALAADQHIQMFRAWGSGMPETDEFYDLCNRYGIMVMQEWPTAWNSHKEGWQPYELLEETVRLNTLRLRNNPALVMWGGGNESDEPFGKAIDMMGRYSVELDGTRAFHRGEPWGGSLHNYDVYWDMQPLAHNLKWKNLTQHLKEPGVFIGEFGLASMPVYESVQRYLPDNEKNLWPAPDGKSFAHHTPVFNKKRGMERLRYYTHMFVPKNCTMEEFSVGSQLAQVTAIRHTLELSRARWPKTTGALYYKMNDNYPAASWSCVDWYGAPKISYYFCQDSFEPLHGCLLLDSFDTQGQTISLPVYLLDDLDELKNNQWSVEVSAYNAKLEKLKEQSFRGENSIAMASQLGVFELNKTQTKTTPLLLVVKTFKDKQETGRTFYWTQFEARVGCLFALPKTTLTMMVKEKTVVIENQGPVPAVGVNLQCPGFAHEFTAGDNYFWLEPGEAKTVSVNRNDPLVLSSWNSY